MDEFAHKAESILETVFGGGAISGGTFALIFHDAYPVLSFIAVLCGAILGVHGVWSIIRGRPHKVHNIYNTGDDDNHE